MPMTMEACLTRHAFCNMRIVKATTDKILNACYAGAGTMMSHTKCAMLYVATYYLWSYSYTYDDNKHIRQHLYYIFMHTRTNYPAKYGSSYRREMHNDYSIIFSLLQCKIRGTAANSDKSLFPDVLIFAHVLAKWTGDCEIVTWINLKMNKFHSYGYEQSKISQLQHLPTVLDCKSCTISTRTSYSKLY